MTMKNKRKYSPPALFDLGSTEGVGECTNGTGVRKCETGYSFNPGSGCDSGTVATTHCAGGALFEGDCSGGLGASKGKLDSGDWLKKS